MYTFHSVQRKVKYQEAKLKALKARNEYILCLEASNTTIHKYFVDDLSDLIDVSSNNQRKEQNTYNFYKNHNILMNGRQR